MAETIERLPDEKVQITYISCKDCGFPVFASVNHLMDKQGKKEIAELVVDGHPCKTIPLLEYRKMETKGWCDTRCKEGKENI